MNKNIKSTIDSIIKHAKVEERANCMKMLESLLSATKSDDNRRQGIMDCIEVLNNSKES